MPELPEVEAARRAVHEHCGGKVIVKAMIADDPKVIEGISPSELEKALVGKKIIAAHRKGKNMWLQLDTPPFPSFQFGMTGAVYIKGVSVTKYKRSAINDNDEWPSKFSKVFVELDDGMEMSFTDKRRLAKVRLLENPEVVPPISELGPDALLNPIAEDDFINALSKRGTAIKSLLLDQGFISGIGNWVADEVLYKARIHPLQVASTVSKEKCIALHKCIKEVIEKALEVGADSSQYPENWIFHSREKKPGKAFVDGKKIDFITVGSRTSAFVPDLQKIDGPVPGNQPVRKGGNRSKKKGDVVESEKFPNDQEIGDDDDEGKDKKGQGKRGRKSTKTTKAQTGSSNSTKTTKARTGSSNASGAGGKKSANKAAEDEKPKKRSGWKTLDEIESSIQGDATLKEKAESEQELEKEEIKEVKLDHITKKRGKGQESAKVGMTETAASGKMGKNKRKIAAKVEKPRKKGTTKKDNEVDMLDQTNNLDASAKTSENAS